MSTSYRNKSLGSHLVLFRVAVTHVNVIFKRNTRPIEAMIHKEPAGFK